MQIHNWPFLLLCSLAGLLLVLGSLILLAKGILSLGKEGEKPSMLEVLGQIKFSTHGPVLMMFVIGALLLAYPIYSSASSCSDPAFHNKSMLRMVKLKGKIIKDGGADVQVYAVVDEQEAGAGDDIDLEVPYLDGRRYVVRYMDRASGLVMAKEEFRLEKGEQERTLRGIRAVAGANNAPAVPAAQPQAEQKEIADEFKN